MSAYVITYIQLLIQHICVCLNNAYLCNMWIYLLAHTNTQIVTQSYNKENIIPPKKKKIVDWPREMVQWLKCEVLGSNPQNSHLKAGHISTSVCSISTSTGRWVLELEESQKLMVQLAWYRQYQQRDPVSSKVEGLCVSLGVWNGESNLQSNNIYILCNVKASTNKTCLKPSNEFYSQLWQARETLLQMDN